MKLKYLKRKNYFIIEGKNCPFYLDEKRKITRLWDGVFITGLFNSMDNVIKINKNQAVRLLKIVRLSNK